MLRYAITDRTYRIAGASRWAENGVDFVLLRDPTLDPAPLRSFAQSILEDIDEVPGAKTRLLIHRDPILAAQLGAAGFHLTARPDERTPDEARALFAHHSPREPIVSISSHTLAEVERAVSFTVDLILFGPVFEKPLPDAPPLPGTGLALLAAACRAAGSTPVLALGGVTASNTAECLHAGAAGVAGIRLFA